MEMIQELSALRASLQELCEKTDQIIEQCRVDGSVAQQSQENAPGRTHEFESVYPLNRESGFFKGRSPVAVIFPDGVRIETPTWKKLTEVVMKRCNDDAGKHAALMGLRNHIHGRSRQILGNSSAGMRSHIKIDRGLYMEAHYDTESLLKIMKLRILDAVDYDYSGIQVAVRNG